MPWTTRKNDKGSYDILKKLPDGSMKKVGESTSLAKAKASIRARYASKND